MIWYKKYLRQEALKMLKLTKLTIITLIMLALSMGTQAFEEPRTAGDHAFQALIDNSTTTYVQQNQYDDAGNFYIVAGFRSNFYHSADKYADEGLVLVKTQNSIVALLAIQESWSLTNGSAVLERVSAATLDLTGVKNLKVINATLPATQYGPRIVLLARGEMPLKDMTSETLDAWIKVITKEADHLKAQFYLAPELSNNWIGENGYEKVLTAPEVVIKPHTTVRAVRNNPSIPEYPMWIDESNPNPVKNPAVSYGNVSLEGWDLNNSWRHDANGTLTTPLEGTGCISTQNGVTEGNCPLGRDQNILLLKNNGTESVNVSGWKVLWYEDVDPINHDDFRRVIVEIGNFTIPAKSEAEYGYDYPYGPKFISPEGSLYLYDTRDILVDKWGPNPYRDLTVVDGKFKDSWYKTESYPTVFVNSNEFLGLRFV